MCQHTLWIAMWAWCLMPETLLWLDFKACNEQLYSWSKGPSLPLDSRSRQSLSSWLVFFLLLFPFDASFLLVSRLLICGPEKLHKNIQFSSWLALTFSPSFLLVHFEANLTAAGTAVTPPLPAPTSYPDEKRQKVRQRAVVSPQHSAEESENHILIQCSSAYEAI